ncbi:hypothetical protein B7463_g11135, partial [Scytalidium lignicola]
MTSDPTFRSYKLDQAQQYAGLRPGYPSVLYDHIFAQHAATSGSFNFVLDVGCGPGIATRDLAPAFKHAVGVDPGEEMLKAARERGGETKSGEKIRFELCEAEKIASAPGVPLGELDMITAATASHWFDMKKFWEQAAQLLRPGGTVAIWTKGDHYARKKLPSPSLPLVALLFLSPIPSKFQPDPDPDPAMPYAAKIKEIQDAFQRVVEPYQLLGNRIARNMYDDLVLPWVADPSQTAFPKEKFQRFDWDRGGVLSDGKDFLGGSHEVPFGVYEKVMGTISPVTRWREAHPELAGTERDCVTEVVRKLKCIRVFASIALVQLESKVAPRPRGDTGCAHSGWLPTDRLHVPPGKTVLDLQPLSVTADLDSRGAFSCDLRNPQVLHHVVQKVHGSGRTTDRLGSQALEPYPAALISGVFGTIVEGDGSHVHENGPVIVSTGPIRHIDAAVQFLQIQHMRGMAKHLSGYSMVPKGLKIDGINDLVAPVKQYCPRRSRADVQVLRISRGIR